METDPLERIAVALVDAIRARRSEDPAPDPLPQSSPVTGQTAVADAPPLGGRRNRELRVRMFPEHYNLRIRAEDRERFDAYAYRHRLMKGEVFQRMLDALEDLERAQKGKGAGADPSKPARRS